MALLSLLARLWHCCGKQSNSINLIKGKRHGNNDFIYFLPRERVARFRAVLEMCGLV